MAVNPQQFKFLYQLHENTHGLNAIGEDDYSKGWMQWDDKTGELQHIFTNWDERRQGIATQMWNRAQRLASERGITAPVHSKMRTNDGNAWAKSLGVELPKRTRASYGPNASPGVPMDWSSEGGKYEILPE
jgi:GNAT superfamily N-acetyltransferase